MKHKSNNKTLFLPNIQGQTVELCSSRYVFLVSINFFDAEIHEKRFEEKFSATNKNKIWKNCSLRFQIDQLEARRTKRLERAAKKLVLVTTTSAFVRTFLTRRAFTTRSKVKTKEEISIRRLFSSGVPTTSEIILSTTNLDEKFDAAIEELRNKE